MDLQDQLKQLFPDHEPEPEQEDVKASGPDIWKQDAPIRCVYEKRKGKPVTILEGYTGADKDFKILAKEIKTRLGVGGSYKKDQIIIQGDYRNQIMAYLQELGFKVKRVGG